MILIIEILFTMLLAVMFLRLITVLFEETETFQAIDNYIADIINKNRGAE